MNKIFIDKKTTKIELDNNFYLEPDQFKGIVLVFTEQREKTNKKTNFKENYIFEDRFYFPKLSQTLKKYLTLTQNNSTTLNELLENVLRVENKIDNILN